MGHLNPNFYGKGNVGDKLDLPAVTLGFHGDLPSPTFIDRCFPGPLPSSQVQEPQRYGLQAAGASRRADYAATAPASAPPGGWHQGVARRGGGAFTCSFCSEGDGGQHRLVDRPKSRPLVSAGDWELAECRRWRGNRLGWWMYV